MSTRGYLFNSDTSRVYLNNNKYASQKLEAVVIRTKENLMERYGLLGLVDVANKLDVMVQDDCTSAELTEAVWRRFKEITSAQIRDERRAKRASNNEDTGESRGRGNHTSKPRRVRWPRTYKVCFEAIGKELRPTGGSRLPQQARTILDHLRQQSVELFTEQEMMDFVQKLADDGHLTSHRGKPLKQSPQRIFAYYENTFHQYGLVVRRIEREYQVVG
jgi:hypothetical protein